MLYHALDFSEMKTLDLFGGTGSISYELASRGVPQLTIIEKDPTMFEFIRKTAATLGIQDLQVIKMDVFKYIAQSNDRFDFIFAGPPYALSAIDELPRQIFEKKLLTEQGWFVLEHTPRNDYKDFPFYKAEKKYGTTIFSVFVENPRLRDGLGKP